MEELNLRNYAHLGDAVWELKVREKTIYETQHTKELHKLTTQYVNAGHQAELLRLIEPHLTENEQDLVRKSENKQFTKHRIQKSCINLRQVKLMLHIKRIY